MKKEIEIADSITIVNRKKVQIEIPETVKYYKRNDDGKFFPIGLILFAIIPKSDTTLYLVEIEKGKQDYNDFVPHDDCKQEYWLNPGVKIRKTAFDIMTAKHTEWTEIEAVEFDEKRKILLDYAINLRNDD